MLVGIVTGMRGPPPGERQRQLVRAEDFSNISVGDMGRRIRPGFCCEKFVKHRRFRKQGVGKTGERGNTSNKKAGGRANRDPVQKQEKKQTPTIGERQKKRKDRASSWLKKSARSPANDVLRPSANRLKPKRTTQRAWGVWGSEGGVLCEKRRGIVQDWSPRPVVERQFTWGGRIKGTRAPCSGSCRDQCGKDVKKKEKEEKKRDGGQEKKS